MGWWVGGFGYWGTSTLGALLLGLLSLLSLVLWIVLMVKAAQGVRFKLPWAGDIAREPRAAVCLKTSRKLGLAFAACLPLCGRLLLFRQASPDPLVKIVGCFFEQSRDTVPVENGRPRVRGIGMDPANDASYGAKLRRHTLASHRSGANPIRHVNTGAKGEKWLGLCAHRPRYEKCCQPGLSVRTDRPFATEYQADN